VKKNRVPLQAQRTVCQQSSDLPTHKLVQDIKTRWNSTFSMLQQLYEQLKALSLNSVEHGGIIMLRQS